MNIILTNDDGIHENSIQILYSRLKEMGHNVKVVAPAENCSAVSGSSTFNKPLITSKLDADQTKVYAQPADCVNLALRGLYPNWADIVISGINKGLNAGHTIYESGTVAAARRASLLGTRSIAVSYDNYEPTDKELEEATEFLMGILGNLEDAQLKDIGNGRFISINIPRINGTKGIELKHEICTLSNQFYGVEFDETSDGIYNYKHLPPTGHEEGCEYHAIHEGKVSVVLLNAL